LILAQEFFPKASTPPCASELRFPEQLPAAPFLTAAETFCDLNERKTTTFSLLQE
jgi:hypothetical protein